MRGFTKNTTTKGSPNTSSHQNGKEPFFGVQAKLAIGKPNDTYEKEADSMADTVVERTHNKSQSSESSYFFPSAPATTVQKKPFEEVQKKENTDIQEKPLAATITPVVQLEQAEEPVQEKYSDSGSIKDVQKKPFEEVQKKPFEEVQKQEEEEAQAKEEGVQMMEEEEVQTKEEGVQMMEEEEAQTKEEGVQMMEEEEAQTKEEGIQMMEEEEAQTKEEGVQMMEEEEVQTKVDRPSPPKANISKKITDARGKGSPLSTPVKSQMEGGFGADFSGVRVHTDSGAAEMNKDLGAKAFTAKNDIFFNEGQFNPASKEGQTLLAHELTHTVQQGASSALPEKPKGDAGAVNGSDAGANAAPQKEGALEPPANEEGTALVEGGEEAAIDGKEVDPDAAKGEGKEKSKGKGGKGKGAKDVKTTPRSPEEDPNFKKMEGRVDDRATAQQNHEEPTASAGAAQSAAMSPANERDSMAQAGQVDQMEEAEAGEFSADDFKAKLMERIESMQLPANQEEADDFEDNNNIDEVNAAATQDAQSEQAAAAGPIEQTSQQEPNTDAVPEREVTPLPEPPIGEQPATVDPSSAMPPTRGAGEVEQPLQENSEEVDQQMADNEITDEQLANSNEPSFQEALGSKNTAQEDAASRPAQVRQQESSAQAGAQASATAQAETGLQGMHQDRTNLMNQVAGQQQQTGDTDTVERTRIAGEINTIYENTKTDVETILGDLDTEVNSKFSAGTEAAKAKFENYVDRKMDAYKDRRYSGVLGKGRWIKDKFAGMPDEVNEFFVDGKKEFIKHMDGVITEVSNIVATKLTAAKDRVTLGKQQVQDYVSSLPENLQQIGKDAADEITTKFDELEDSVNSKQDELIDNLANQYNDALKAVDARIEEMKAANRGLIDMALDAIAGVIKTIIEIKNMLTELLLGAISAIGAIISDPIGFLGNLISGVSQGFTNFGTNILKHLQSGLIQWLTGTLGPVGITIPDDLFSLKGIFSLVAQILGLTWDFIRNKAVKLLGEPVVQAMEVGLEIFQVLRTGGIDGVWEYLKEQFNDLKETVIGAIKEMVITTVIEAGIKWVLGLMNPASAFVKACMMIIDVVRFFIERGSQIIELVKAFTEGVKAVASGSVSAVADAIENALARAVPVIIGFLASLLGISGLARKVQKIIGKIRKRIDKAVDKLILKAKKAFKGLVKKGKAKVKGAVSALLEWWKKDKKFTASDGKKHRLYFKGSGKNAKLMVRSEEQDYKNFVTNLVIADSDPKKSEKQAAKTAALAALGEIEKLKAAGEGATTDADTKRNSTAFEKQLDILSQKSAILMESAEGEIPESTPAVYGARNAGGFASSMKIDVLTKKGTPGSGANTALTTGTFDKLGKRHESKGSSRRFYKHGHLLSSDLHGPGTDFKNLTPQSESGNQTFERGVERTLKTNVNKPDGDSPAIYTFKVEAIYQGRSDKGALKQAIENDYIGRKAQTDDDAVKATLDTELADKKAIVDAEDHVATKFVATAKPLNNKLEPISGESYSNEPVPNEIKRVASKYVLPTELSDAERQKKKKKKSTGTTTRPARDVTTRTQIDQVKAKLNSGETNMSKIAREVGGISGSTVARIRDGKIT